MLLLCALSLAVKAVVPVGFMVGTQSRVVTVEFCADSTGERMLRQITIPLDHSHDRQETSKTSQGCAFSSLGAGGLAAQAPALIAAAIAFVLAMGFGPVTLPLIGDFPHIRPAPRAPPARASLAR